MLVNNDWTQQGLLNLVTELQNFYSAPQKSSVSGKAAAETYRALAHALKVVEADQSALKYIKANLPDSYKDLSLKEQIREAITNVEKSSVVSAGDVNQPLECLVVLLRDGKLKPYKPERTLLIKAVASLKGEPTTEQLKAHEEHLLEHAGRNLDELVIAYNHAHKS